MSVLLVSTPDPLALTKGGRMSYTFTGSGRVVTLGTKAVSLLLVAAPVTDGTKLPFKWNGKAITLQFKTNPSDPGEFSAGDGSSDYIDSLLDELQSFYPIREDFVLTRNTNPVLPGILFTARQAGPAYNIIPTLKITSTFGFGSSIAGADAIVRTQYSVYAEVWMQKPGTPGTDPETDFERIFSPTIECDANGSAQMDVGSILHGRMEPDWPLWGAFQQPTGSYSSQRRYFVAYAEAWGYPVQIGKIQRDDIRIAYLGGADYINRSGSGLLLNRFAGGSPAQDLALRYGSHTRYILPDEPQWLTFLNQRTDEEGSRLKVVLTLDNQDQLTLTGLYAPQDIPQGAKITYPVGPLQLGLADQVPAGRSLVEYSVQRISASSSPLSVVYRFIINGDYRPYTRYFAYLSSLGVVETLSTYGKGSYELNVFNEQAERYLPTGYEVADGQFAQYDTATQQQQEVTTGFWPESVLRDWTDFYRSPFRFQLLSGKALPIGLLSKSIKQLKDADTLFAHKFEFVRLFKDEFYTADETAQVGDGSPPLNFKPGGSVILQPPLPVLTRDDSVPDAAREIDSVLLAKLRQKAAEPNPETLGFLRQDTTDQLYFRQDQGIDYQTDVVNKPAVPTLQTVTEQPGGNSTSLPIEVGDLQMPEKTDTNGQSFAGWVIQGGKQILVKLSQGRARDIIGITLDWLLDEFPALTNLRLNNQANVLYNVNPENPGNRGLYFDLGALGFIGRGADGRLLFQINDNLKLFLDGRDKSATLAAEHTTVTGSHRAKQYEQPQLIMATRPLDYSTGYELQEDGSWKMVAAPKSPGSGDTTDLIIKRICWYEEEIPPETEQSFVVTPDRIGQPIDHLLYAKDFHIDIKYLSGKPVTELVVTKPDLDHFKLELDPDLGLTNFPDAVTVHLSRIYPYEP